VIIHCEEVSTFSKIYPEDTQSQKTVDQCLQDSEEKCELRIIGPGNQHSNINSNNRTLKKLLENKVLENLINSVNQRIDTKKFSKMEPS
jgi:hypothetical protein